MTNSWERQGRGPLNGQRIPGPLSGLPIVGAGGGRAPDFSEADPPTFALDDQTALRRALAEAAERKRNGGFSVDNIMRTLGRGVLGIGSYLDELDAATNATLAPLEARIVPASWIDLREPTWVGRYNHSLEIQRNKDAGFDAEHPYWSQGLQLGSGVASAIPIAATEVGARLFGLGTDSLFGGVARGAASGAGLAAETGFGNGAGGFENRLGSAADDAPLGSLLGALPALGAQARKLWKGFRGGVKAVESAPKGASRIPAEPDLTPTGAPPASPEVSPAENALSQEGDTFNSGQAATSPPVPTTATLGQASNAYGRGVGASRDQFFLPRVVPVRGASDRMGDLLVNDSVFAGLVDAVERGKAVGAHEWLYSEPLLEDFKSELGNRVAETEFPMLLRAIAATSPATKNNVNIRNASYLFTKSGNGQVVTTLPSLYRGIAWPLHLDNWRQMQAGGINPLKRPKTASYGENLLGNFLPIPIDRHLARAPGMLAEDLRFLKTRYQAVRGGPVINPREAVRTGKLDIKEALKTPAMWIDTLNPGEYGDMEQLYRQVADATRLMPAEAANAARIGAGHITGFHADPASSSLIGGFKNRWDYTALQRGLPIQEVWSRVIRKAEPFLGIAPLLPIGLGAIDGEQPGSQPGRMQ